jgi:hypothetical protein
MATPKEVAIALDTNTVLSREVIEIFVTTWSENSTAVVLSNIIQAGLIELYLVFNTNNITNELLRFYLCRKHGRFSVASWRYGRV